MTTWTRAEREKLNTRLPVVANVRPTRAQLEQRLERERAHAADETAPRWLREQSRKIVALLEAQISAEMPDTHTERGS